MCQKTEAGLVQSVGKRRLEVRYKHPKFLQDFQYVIFKEEEDMLGLFYHAVCIDFALDFRGKTPDEAIEGLADSVVSFIDVTLRHTTDRSKAYSALREQKENRSEKRELIYKVYNEVLVRNATLLYAKVRPQNKRLFDSVNSKPQYEFHNEYVNFYVHAYSAEDIENLYNSQKLSIGKIKKIVASNNLLLNNIVVPTVNLPQKQQVNGKRMTRKEQTVTV